MFLVSNVGCRRRAATVLPTTSRIRRRCNSITTSASVRIWVKAAAVDHPNVYTAATYYHYNSCRLFATIDHTAVTTSGDTIDSDSSSEGRNRSGTTADVKNHHIVRLSKLLSQHAHNPISRRQAEKLIQAGQVTIAGQVVQNSASIVNLNDILPPRQSNSSGSSISTSSIKVNGKALQLDWNRMGSANAESTTTTATTSTTIPQVWAVHKVAGEVVAEHDPQGRPSLMDRLRRGGVGRKHGKSKQMQHLKPIGRLDIPTEGLLLVTNDGDYAREMELPSSALHRVYRARVHGRLTPYKLDRIRRGAVLYENNVKYGPMKVAVERKRGRASSSSRRGRDGSAAAVATTGTNTWLQVTCTEGKNRQVRNVFAALGMTVTRLIRISYGDYHLDTIPKGMAIPVPYKPVAKQRAKGTIGRPTSPTKRGTQQQNSKRGEQASPVKWISSVQARSMSTSTSAKSTHASEGQLTSQQVLQEDVVSMFPQENLVYCFGYGSGVFSQTLQDATRQHEGLLDLIFVVDDTRAFHEANLQIFPQHYTTWLRLGGPSLATNVQRHFPLPDARVMFHVVDDPVPMKYGVVDQEDLMEDLTQWNTLYLSGRLHKPTLPLIDPPPDWFADAQNRNLQAASAAALLLMTSLQEDELTFAQFCQAVASLSYTGDFRMQFGGEDPQKLTKLVTAPGQLQRFCRMYRPILEQMEANGDLLLTDSGWDDRTSFGIQWDPTNSESSTRFQTTLPASIQACLSPAFDAQQVATALSSALSATVAPAARRQSFKGVGTLGFRRSLKYASAKLSKGLFATRKG